MAKQKPKVILVSYSYPPYVTPSAVLINNIFQSYRGDIVGIGGSNFTKVDPTFNPPCKSYYVKHPQGRVMEAILRRYHFVFTLYYFFKILKICKREKPDVIFGNYPKDAMLVASFQVANRLGIPFYVYMHDLWEENMTSLATKRFSKKWEKKILTEASRVIVCTEKAQSHYSLKYGIKSDILLHPIVDDDIPHFNTIETKSEPRKKYTIAYSGSLSTTMNRDAFKVMSQAMEILPPNYELLWLPITKIEEDVLLSSGITSKKIRQKIVNRVQHKEELKKADIVFAPLSLKNGHMEEILTVFSNKLLSYLVSGTPILIFGPSDSHHCQKATEGKWGYVVDQDSDEILAKAIIEMTSEGFDTDSLVNNALKEADRRRSSRMSNRLFTWVKNDIN